MRLSVCAAVAAALGLCLAAVLAQATPMIGLPAVSGINATDTIPACQVASGSGASNPLSPMPMASVLGPVGTAISGMTTLGNSQNHQLPPVTGSDYTITFPAATSSTLPPGSKITLAAAPGAPIDVCVASGSAFDTNSAPRAAALFFPTASGSKPAPRPAIITTRRHWLCRQRNRDSQDRGLYGQPRERRLPDYSAELRLGRHPADRIVLCCRAMGPPRRRGGDGQPQ
jgi:hypothetical protein